MEQKAVVDAYGEAPVTRRSLGLHLGLGCSPQPELPWRNDDVCRPCVPRALFWMAKRNIRLSADILPSHGDLQQPAQGPARARAEGV